MRSQFRQAPHYTTLPYGRPMRVAALAAEGGSSKRGSLDMRHANT